MKKRIFVVVLAVLCAGLAFSQTAVTLDAGIGEAMQYLVGRLPRGAKVVVLNFNAQTDALADYVIEELTAYIVNDGNLTVVDRRNLELLQQELNFQMSGEVNEATAQEIGMKLGAQTIISGSMTPLGGVYRMRIQAIEVETAQIQGVRTENIALDWTLAALLEVEYDGAMPVMTAPPSQSSSTASSQEKSAADRARDIVTGGSGSGAGSSAPAGEETKKAAKKPSDDAWKNKKFYLGLWMGGAYGFNFGVQAQWQLARFFALDLEVGLSTVYDGSDYYSRHPDENPYYVDGIASLLAKLTFRPWKMAIDIGVGPSLSLNNGIGVAMSLALGFKAGPGILFVDWHYGSFPNYTTDFVSVGAGYQIGFFDRKKK